MMRFISQMLKLPLTAFVYSMEMFVRTMHGLQKLAEQGVDVITNGVAASLGDALNSQSDSKIDATAREMAQAPGYMQSSQENLGDDKRTSVTSSIVTVDDKTNRKEDRKMADTNLNDDMLKLIRYKILFVKRDYEYAFPEREELVADNLSATDYTAWKIADFMQHLDQFDAPSKWMEQNFPRDFGPPTSGRDTRIRSLPPDDKKYLRVFFEVLDRYVREELKYEEDEIKVLKQIRDAILVSKPGTAGGGTTAAAGDTAISGGGTRGGTSGGGRGISSS